MQNNKIQKCKLNLFINRKKHKSLFLITKILSHKLNIFSVLHVACRIFVIASHFLDQHFRHRERVKFLSQLQLFKAEIIQSKSLMTLRIVIAYETYVILCQVKFLFVFVNVFFLFLIFFKYLVCK